jgi:hypothetical protein
LRFQYAVAHVYTYKDPFIDANRLSNIDTHTNWIFDSDARIFGDEYADQYANGLSDQYTDGDADRYSAAADGLACGL